MYKILLPPANKVWGKVMFSEASVILSTGGLRMMSLPCLAAWSHVASKGSQPLVPCSFVLFRGSVTRGSLSREGTVGSPPPPPKWEKRAVHILLECLLVTFNDFFRQSLRFFGWLVGWTVEYWWNVEKDTPATLHPRRQNFKILILCIKQYVKTMVYLKENLTIIPLIWGH